MHNTRSAFVTACVVCAMLLQACAAKPPLPSPQEKEYWSYSRTVHTGNSMITLFDPADLAHHSAEPAGWYQYDFAFANDLDTGRVSAVRTAHKGAFQVRVTSSPLSSAERSAAGPGAVLRLRVINHHLLLAGGNAWPSVERTVPADLFDPRWLNIDNGDYRVTITAMDKTAGASAEAFGVTLHDYVFQLESVAAITDVTHAPGIPQLVAGKKAAYPGLNAGGLHYNERCAQVPRSAEWSPLSSPEFPLPGANQDVAVSAELHSRGRALQLAGEHAAIPFVIAREAVKGKLGVFLAPSQWNKPSPHPGDEATARAHILCMVRITGVDAGEAFRLNIEPLPQPLDRLPPGRANQLVEQFELWSRVSNDLAWHFKSGMLRRTVTERSLLLGIMHYLALPPRVAENLLLQSNEVLADKLFERINTK
jgi:hypothetical protein